MMFLDCPAYLDHDRTVRCGLPAEVRCRFTMRSTGGPLEAAMIRCPAGHHFSGAIEALTWDGKDNPDPGTAAATSRARRGSVPGSHDGRDGVGGIDARDFPAGPEPEISRPNTAPAYYLGHPARLWITVMRPRRGQRRPVLSADSRRGTRFRAELRRGHYDIAIDTAGIHRLRIALDDLALTS
jgi:hypothetical protein